MTEDKELNNKLYDLALEKNHGVPAPRGFGHHIDELNKKISDLEAKLAESEEDANKWKSISERLASVLDRFHYLGETPLYNTTREEDKISFAVAELEKVRKYVDGRTYLAQYLDERVKQLKEGK